MAQARRRTDIDASVVDAFDQQLAQALAESQARSGTALRSVALRPGDAEKGYISRIESGQPAQTISEMIDGPTVGPRYIPGAAVERPDAPNLLQQELLDPVIAARNAYLGSEPQRPVAPKTYEIGNELVSLDPISGTPKVLYSAPQKAAPEMTPRQKLEYTDLLSTRRTLMGKPFPTKADQERVAAIDEQIKTFFPEQQTTPAPAQVAPPDLLPPVGFMGAPGGTNLFSAPTPKQSLASTNAPGKRIGRFRVLAQ